MTRDRAKQLVDLFPMIKAYAEGKDIEVLQTTGKWQVINNLDFDSNPSYYRVQSYRAFKDGYECINAVLKNSSLLKNKVTGKSVVIDKITETGVIVKGVPYTYSKLFCDYLFRNEKPFGAKVE